MADGYPKQWVRLLEEEIEQLETWSARERDRLTRAYYMLKILQLKRAIDLLLLGAVFEAASLRAKRLERER